MRKLLTAVLMGALTLLGVTAPASAKQVDRPFKVVYTGATTDIEWANGVGFDPEATSTFNDRCPDGASWLITTAGTGSGTFLGDFTWESVHCTLLTSLTPPVALVYGGEFTYVADNGDELLSTYEAAGDLFVEGDQLCAPTAQTFVGGSGRFTNASGSALEKGCWPLEINSPVIYDLVVTSKGTIIFDASDRHLR